MPVVDFIPYATGAGANVESQATYVADPTTAAGQAIGLARSAVFNKIWRQSAFMASVVANFVSEVLVIDVLDDGDLPTAITNFKNALLTWVGGVYATIAYVDNAVATRGASGSIVAWPIPTAPAGAFECNGQAVSRAGNPKLNAIAASVGYAAPFGPGDGLTTLDIPDMRGYFVRAWDDGAGVDPARTIGSTQADGFKSHAHLNGIPQVGGTTSVYGATNTDIPGASSRSMADTGTAAVDQGATSSVGTTETRPKNIALNYIIWGG